MFVSWVGLRGAVPIIFATYALMSPNVPHATFMFNIVFFITILSLVLQGTSLGTVARKLKLDLPFKEDAFNVSLPDEITAVTSELEVTSDMLSNGCFIKEIKLPPKTLVVMVKRDDKFLVPTGNTLLHIGDHLLLISEEQKHLADLMALHSKE